MFVDGHEHLHLVARKQWPGFVRIPNAPVVGHYLPPLEIIFLIVAFSLWAVRIYGRTAILKTPGLDDLFVSLALLCAIALTVTHLLAVNYGLGRHYRDLYRPDATKLWLTEFIQEWIFPMGALFTKLSILFFYLRFAGAATSSPRFQATVYATMVFITTWTLGICIATSLACRPLALWWSYGITYGSCWTPRTIGVILFVQQALTVISDVIVFALPIHIIWKVRATRAQKCRMIALLGLGFLVCIIATVRIKLILLYLYGVDDNSWYMYSVYPSLSLELHLTIACACLPFCKPVVRAVMPSVHRFSSSTSSRIQRFKSRVTMSTSDTRSRRPTMSSSHMESRTNRNSRVETEAESEFQDVEPATPSIYRNSWRYSARMRGIGGGNSKDEENAYVHNMNLAVPEASVQRGPPTLRRDRIMTVEELEQAMRSDPDARRTSRGPPS